MYGWVVAVATPGTWQLADPGAAAVGEEIVTDGRTEVTGVFRTKTEVTGFVTLFFSVSVLFCCKQDQSNSASYCCSIFRRLQYLHARVSAIHYTLCSVLLCWPFDSRGAVDAGFRLEQSESERKMALDQVRGSSL